MAKNKEIGKPVEETIKEIKESEEGQKEFTYSVDMTGGKVLLHTFGFNDGEHQKVLVNDKEYDVEILDNLGVIATGLSFYKYPAILFLAF